MPPKRPHWETYNEEMSRFDYGHALWEPAPLSYFKRVQLGDVGYIHTGRFRLLFSAGCPLGNKQLGVDVPLTFKRLDIGEIDDREPLVPGCYCSDNVQATPVYPTPSSPPSGCQPPASPPMFESFSKISFQLTGRQGAALVTKYPIYREDTLRGGTFEKYTKENYASWVEFARETGHGDVNPVLVTGVDRTRDFAMLCYSTDSEMSCEFATSIPRISSGWGTWHKTGPVYTSYGPQLRCPPSSTPATVSISSSTSPMEQVSGEYNQCVFIRYYAVRKRLGVPRVIKASAGPHDLGGGGYEDGGSPETRYDPDRGSDSGSDIGSGLLSDGDGSSVTSIETESDIVVHNTVANERDEFDTIADYVFQNSDAQTVLLHHQDTARLRAFGGSADLSTRLLEVRPVIVVDGNGVGTIELRTGTRTVGCQEFPDGDARYSIDQDGTASTYSNPTQTQGSLSNTVTTDIEEVTFRGNYPWGPVDGMAGFPNGSYPDGHVSYFIAQDGNVFAYPKPAQIQGSSSNMVPNTHDQVSSNVGGTSPPQQYSQRPEGTQVPDASMASWGTTAPWNPLLLPPLGVLVPQTPYGYGIMANNRRGFNPQPPIVFTTGDRSGISLQDAMNGNYGELLGRDDGMFVGSSCTAISLRIQWPGGVPWTRHVNTVDWKKPRGPITRSKLSNKIARIVHSFIESNQGAAIAADEWRVGAGHIELKDLILDRIEHVSKASWQPRIYVIRP